MTAQSSTLQRDAALKRANEVRLARAALKRGLRNRSGRLAVALARPEAQAMPIMELLTALPRFGKKRALRLLGRAGIGEHLLVGDLTERRKTILAALYEDNRKPSI